MRAILLSFFVCEGTAVPEPPLGFEPERIERLLDLTVRYAVVQDRAAPRFLHAQEMAVNSRSECANFAEDIGQDRQRLTSAEVGLSRRVYPHFENPLLVGGALIAALALRQASGEKPLETKLIGAMLGRMRAQAFGEPGYLLRYDGKFAGAFEEWERCRFPNGYCTTINQGPYQSEEELYAVNALTRRWEPSSDEYIGVILAIAFVERYVSDPLARAANLALAADVASYLRAHDYYLERPCPDKGVVWRGAYHNIYAEQHERIFERLGLGYHPPRFPSPAEWCARNQLAPTPANALLPCSPVMMPGYVAELTVVLNATSRINDAKIVNDLYLAGIQEPFVTQKGPGVNLMMLQLLASAALFPQQRQRVADYYRQLERVNPSHIEPHWLGILAYTGSQFTEDDEALRARVIADPACAGDALPVGANGWSHDVTLGCLFPMIFLAHRAGHSFDHQISRDALPLDLDYPLPTNGD